MERVIPRHGRDIDYRKLNDWITDYVVVHENEAFRLLRFDEYNYKRDSVLVLPPQAGHTPQIADYDQGQSIIKCAVDNTDKNVYVMDWKSCTTDRGSESYNDLVNQVVLAMKIINTKTHLVGLCQGGTLATVTTSLHPDNIASLTVAGAPIYVDQEGVLKEAIRNPMYMFQMAVIMSGGVMRGDTMLQCWMSSNPTQHYIKRFQDKMTYRKARFDAWYYEFTQNISGAWYLDLVENLFKQNKLYKEEMLVGNQVVKLGNIACPLNLVVGTKDNISPPHHTLKLKDKVSSEKVMTYQGDAGHVGVFMGRKMIQDQWTKLFSKM